MYCCLYWTRSCTCSDKLHIIIATYLQGFVQQQNPKLDQWIILLRKKVAVFVSSTVKNLISVTTIPIVFDKKLLTIYEKLSVYLEKRAVNH